MTKYRTYSTALACACLLASTSAVFAQDNNRFTIETEVEIGIDSTFKSDDPTAELTDVYAVADVGVNFALTDTVSFFTALTFESVLDPTGDRTFEDMGLYVGEIGLSFNLGKTGVSVGKISPAFGIAWDAAPGFYGTAMAEDYELAEMIGATADIEVGSGALSFAVFYADNTDLSKSIGTDRGRNTTAAGGAGNTGKLNNVALQWDQELGNTSYTLGARYLSAGLGDASDETGISAGFVHALNDSVEIMGEVAAFDGWGGSADNATYATLGASFGNGPFIYSGAVTYRDVTSAGSAHMVSLGLDYEFDNGVALGAGYAFTSDAGIDSHAIGVNVVIALGG